MGGENAISAGKAWVGKNYKTRTDKLGNIICYSSSDGMRAFRLSYKPKEQMWRANFQQNMLVNAKVQMFDNMLQN